MSQQARNNPDYQPSYLAGPTYREPVEVEDERDLDEDEPPADTVRSRFLNGVDSGANREYL